MITRALGGPEAAEADYFLLPLPSVERLVLCSDGVSGMIDDERDRGDPARDRRPARRRRPRGRRRVAAGGRDNATAVVVDVVGLVAEDDYDSARQMESLEQKLGALP